MLGLDQIIINDPVHENFKSVEKRVLSGGGAPSLPTSFPTMQQSPALAAAQTDPLSLSTQRQLASQSRGLEGRTAQRVTSRLRIASLKCNNSDTYTWVAIAQLMRMRNLFKHSDELSSSSVMCIESKMEAQSRYSYLARVEKELKAFHKAQESVLVLNYYNLREFPDVLLCDEHCRKRLRKLYLKRNLITSLVQSVN